MGKKYSNGFTLIELIIVLAVIAVLATLITLYFTGQTRKGNDAKRKGDIDRIKVAVEEYEKDNNCYPPMSLMTECGTGSTIAVHPYLNNVPCDPVTHAAYKYFNDGSACPRWFKIYTKLEYLKDSSIILGIGPGSLYNYVRSSENAPVDASSTPSPTISGTPGQDSGFYGCFSGLCREIKYNSNGVLECNPNFQNNTCYGECVLNGQPANECVYVQ